MNTQKFLIGFNIGPIYEVMKHSMKTRELWFGSYLFSLIIKMVYEKLIEKEYTVYKPFYNSSSKEKTTAGLFPDRVVAVSSKEKDVILNELNKITKDVMIEFVKIVNELVLSEEKRTITDKDSKVEHSAVKKLDNDILKIINDYLQLDFVLLPADGINDNEIVKEVESYLDALEVSRSFALGKNEPTCYKCHSLPAVVEVYEQFENTKEQKLCPFCFIKLRSHYCEEIQNLTDIKNEKPFPSVVEISAIELKEKYLKVFNKLLENDEEDIFSDTVIKNDVKDYHKYYALILADGDNLSKVASRLSKPQDLSEYLFNFGQRVHELAKTDFKGEPIYIGGDDIFAIMPLAFKNDDGMKTIFDFVIALNKNYDTMVSKKIPSDGLDNSENTSLSVGVLIAYHKFPLAIAIDEVYKQLNYVAKKIDGKNGLAVMFRQHSGAVSDFRIKFGDPLLKIYGDLISSVLSNDKGFPSVHHKIEKYKSLFINLSAKYQLNNLLEKRFYEGFDDENQRDGFEKLIKTSLIGLKKGEAAKIALDSVCNMIHTLKFIKGEK